MGKVFLSIYIFLVFLYFELILNVSLFNSLPNILYITLFSLFNTLFLFFISSFLNTKHKKIFMYSLISLVTIFFIIQLIYFGVYESVLSIYSILNGGQVFQFIDIIFKTIFKNIFIIISLFIPLGAFFILNKQSLFDYKQLSLNKKIILSVIIIFIYSFNLFSFNFENKSNIYSAYNLYYKTQSPTASVKKLGFVTTLRLDLQRLIFGFTESSIIPTKPNEKELQTPDGNQFNDELTISYNKIEIDFDQLIKNSKDDTIKNIHNYFNSQSPTAKHEYTGIFKNKNLIVILGESFSNIAINKDITPTLYKLYNQGFQFDNFYTPLFPVSTADGEYITATSLIPKEGIWSLKESSNNYFPYSYPNVFGKLGYSSWAYHNHRGTYYNRDQFIKSQGYDTYKACNMGLNINCRVWPESDLEMMQASIKDYINEDKFITYYITVSGHLNYTRVGNMMVSKNWNKVKDLNMSNLAKGYLAAHIELDKAIEYLIEQLEMHNKLDDTVIVISGDHYPYGLELEHINELSNYTRDDNFDKHHMPLLIWNSEMEKSIKVNKYGSSLDVLPTVLNLFGVDYDSRLLLGKDILSDTDPLVIFSNRSFITDKGRYNSLTKKFETNFEVSKQYVDNLNIDIYNKYQISRLILERDYYNIIRKEIK